MGLKKLLLAGMSVLVAVPAAVVVFGSAPTPPPCGVAGDGVPLPDGTGRPLTARVATWNSYFFNSTPNVTSGVRAIAAQADVIGLQEFGPAAKQETVKRRLPGGWDVYTTPDNMTGVAWRSTKYKVLAKGVERSFGVVHIEDGASGTTIGPRSVLWVTLQDQQTGAVLTEINAHIVPTIDRAGRPDTTRPERLALYQQQIDQIGRLTDRFKTQGAVAVTGDFNVDAEADSTVQSPAWPYTAMQKLGLYSNWRALGYPQSGTHEGGRLIDYVWSTTQIAAPTAQTVLPRYGSDHAPVVVTLDSHPSPATARPAAAANLAPAAPSPAAPAAAGAVPATLTVPGRDGKQMTLSGEQVPNAAAIIAEGKAAHIPEQGWVVALAAALQESKIKNLDYGDRDSLGLFQQRPSKGWGTRDQITTPSLAIRAFYGVAAHTHNPGLTDIRSWRSHSIAESAQAVQGSAFPTAYADWETTARSIVQQLTGTISVTGTSAGQNDMCADQASGAATAAKCPPSNSPAEKGLTPDALLVLRCSAGTYPKITTFYGTSGSMDHATGRAVDIMLSSAYPDVHSPEASKYGWEIATWARANARQLGVKYVIFAARIWSVQRDDEGWRPYTSITGHADDSSLHYNHVHVSVFGTQGTGFPAAGGPGSVSVAAGKWSTPMPAGSYSLGCGFGCYPGHTGQDYPAHSGTPVYATDNGVVVRSVALKAGGRYVSYGNLIVIKAADAANTTVYYAHLKRRLVTNGTTVRAGQQIGLSGYTGHVIPQGEAGAHLHYEIRVKGSPANPLPILRQHGVTP